MVKKSTSVKEDGARNSKKADVDHILGAGRSAKVQRMRDMVRAAGGTEVAVRDAAAAVAAVLDVDTAVLDVDTLLEQADIREALESKKRPAAVLPELHQAFKRPAAAGKADVQEANEETATEAEPEPFLHKILITKARWPTRTYVTACQCQETGQAKCKQQLILEFKENAFPDHLGMATKLKDAIIEGNLTFGEARALRHTADFRP
jgi:hypothetical protein